MKENKIATNYYYYYNNLRKGNLTLIHIPEKFMDYKMCLQAVRRNARYDTLKYIPKKYFTKELCLQIVKTNPASIEHIPEEYKTEDLCKAAIESIINRYDRQIEHFVNHIPEDLRKRLYIQYMYGGK